MKTSYFSYFNKHSRPSNCVSIATKTPEWFGKCDTYPSLFPGWKIISPYKGAVKALEKGTYFQIDGIPITSMEQLNEWYIETYYTTILSKLDAKKVYEDLKDKTILCYEKSGDFCHRYVVAAWLKIELGVSVKEYK